MKNFLQLFWVSLANENAMISMKTQWERDDAPDPPRSSRPLDSTKFVPPTLREGGVLYGGGPAPFSFIWKEEGQPSLAGSRYWLPEISPRRAGNFPYNRT